ncbi:MAG: zinc-dependent metalloprotease [Gammaproteobacteria bacterium]|nr:zinc-dependent metalloprotease [Gammaproteobacteria bacterium]
MAAAAANAPALAEQALLPVHVDLAGGRILLTLPPPDGDGVYGRFLYAASMQTGLGSAAVTLDRGLIGGTQLVDFRRVGTKVAVAFENPRFRAQGGTAAERRGVSESFPTDVVWMSTPVSTTPAGGVVIDLAPFLAQDSMHVAEQLGTAGGAPFKLVPALSTAMLRAVQAFPDNIEFAALQTFQSSNAAKAVREVSPDPDEVSFVIHSTLIRLPPPGYTPLPYDIRAGGEPIQIYDYTAPLGRRVEREFATRFRLQKIHPDRARSRVRKPIVVYVDNAAPPQIQQALIRGVKLWTKAFEDAGFIDAFQVKVLPEGVSPYDVRYNVVFWDDRLTRSWSYGERIVDPRTGEIVRGVAVLGSLRTRQDIHIFHALVGTKNDDTGGPNDPVRVTLARLTQLAAHEVGHTLGFSHNFAASTQDRASVMDYPGPRIRLTHGRIDLSQAYSPSLGRWDLFAVNWLYGEPPPGESPERDASAKADAMMASGARYITDIDSRAEDSPTPWATLWDDGPDPVAGLEQIMRVRNVALNRFDDGVLRPNEPLADLRREFVLVWLLHRYEVVAAAKLIGGVDYDYAINGHAHPPAKPVDAQRQMAALSALLRTLDTSVLTVPRRLLADLSYGIHGADNRQYDQEVLEGAGAAVFDPLVAADVGAQVTLNALLAPTRLTRVYEQHLSDPSLPSLPDLLDRLLATTLNGEHDAVGRRVAYRTLMSLERATYAPGTSPDVAALIEDRLRRVAVRLGATRGDDADAAWRRSMAHLIGDPKLLKRQIAQMTPAIPPGMPF